MLSGFTRTSASTATSRPADAIRGFTSSSTIGLVVREKVPDPDEDAGQRVLVDGRGPAKPPEERRPPPLGEHRARGLGRERREPDRHVAEELGQHAAETDQHRGPEARVAPAADEELESLRHLLLHQERPRADPRLERVHRPGQRLPSATPRTTPPASVRWSTSGRAVLTTRG